MSLILASASPRRKELLGLFRIPFEIRVADIDETMAGAPYDEVARVSRRKAQAVPRNDGDTVIAADAASAVRPGSSGDDRCNGPPG